MSEIDDLTAFYAARLDEAEAQACGLMRTAQDVSLSLQDPALLGRYIPGWYSWPKVEAMCTGRLDDIKLKRAVLADVARICEVSNDLGAFRLAVRTMRQLGTEFDGHPEYKEAWRP